MRDYQANIRQQKGATLVVALIVLVVLMLLGVTAVVTSNTQYKLAGNLQFENGAKNSAENQIAIAEDWVSVVANAENTCFVSTCLTGKLYTPGSVSDPTTILTSGTDYIIELLAKNTVPPGSNMGRCGDVGVSFNLNLYRITARGSDGRGATRYVQSIFQTKIPC